jgi:hypothetical protein
MTDPSIAHTRHVVQFPVPQPSRLIFQGGYWHEQRMVRRCK